MNPDITNASLIGIDWGTSSLRAYLLDHQGCILDVKNTDLGIMRVPEMNFDGVFTELLNPWFDQRELPVIASGMITSRNGWLETPYQPLPTNAEALANSLVPLTTKQGLTLHLMNGVTVEHEGAPDVIRGEETQIVGAIHTGITNGTFVMPGTHSKWVSGGDGSIQDFSTFMSGEVYEALSKHTILGALMSASTFAEKQFIEGVRHGYDAGSQLLHNLFHVRTRPLFGKIKEETVSDYLSGMLIGAEIRGATERTTAAEPLIIVGRNDLADRYEKALSAIGQASKRAEENIVALGHFAIATAAGLIR
ncbi:MAG: 2-dehydro-3-deoxygalactonokinase [Gammaproteobacteria bacterium]|nr:2-dehydro-3-deoxygalactonokinase [Gammaproteobacteria bacterium]